jgi:predicted XRE-type DNA-binding protein
MTRSTSVRNLIDWFGVFIPMKIAWASSMRLGGHMAKFPSEQELKVIRKKVAKVKGSQGLPPDATPLDRAKYDVCEQILIFMKKKKITQRDLAEVLNTSETRVSEMVHYRIQKFTLDRLIGYLQVIKPMLTLKVA